MAQLSFKKPIRKDGDGPRGTFSDVTETIEIPGGADRGEALKAARGHLESVEYPKTGSRGEPLYIRNISLTDELGEFWTGDTTWIPPEHTEAA